MKDKQLPRRAFKLWLETSDGYVYGPGVHALLQKVKETGTLKEAALTLEMSYRYAWGLIKKAEENIGEHLITAHKGGRSGGGGTALTDVGHQYIQEFNEFKKTIMEASKQEKTIHVAIKGKILEIINENGHSSIKVKIEDGEILILNLPQPHLTGVNIGDTLLIEILHKIYENLK